LHTLRTANLKNQEEGKREKKTTGGETKLCSIAR